MAARDTAAPDPFTEEEQEQLLDWLLQKRPVYFPFVATLFLTGMRPSEVVALRWGDVDIRHATISIGRSRYLGSEGATKTRRSNRTIRVIGRLVPILRNLKPPHASADAYIFTNAKNGGPIDQSEWPKVHWSNVLRRTGIRPRKFYATRHTFISVALTKGVNLKWLAEYCGTSVMMIERSYGRFLASGDENQLRLLGGGERSVRQVTRPTTKTRDLGHEVSGLRRKTQAG